VNRRVKIASHRERGRFILFTCRGSHVDTDRNLLFAVLALQADLLDRERFVQACTLWAARKDVPLADLLIEQGWLTTAGKGVVDQLIEFKLRKHGGDVQASLADAAGPAVQRSLAELADPDVQASLCHLVPTPAGERLDAVASGPTLANACVQPATTPYQPDKREHYTLTRLHATGGIGRVWLARDEELGREVALKELRPEQAGNPAAVARFVEEARIAAQLQHPGIIPVHELSPGSAAQTPFYTMKFVRGRTLADAARQYHQRRERGAAGPLELRELLSAFIAVCQAVAYAHSRGVIHRDLKPSNVALGDYGEVLVFDFGLSRVARAGEHPAAENAASLGPISLPEDASRGQTLQGQVLGTPGYMAPEQAEGRLNQIDRRSDVYGLGAILYEILTGQPPFCGRDTPVILRKVVSDQPVPPRQQVSSVPAPVEAICLKALSRQRADRYATAVDLAVEVQRFLADEPVQAYPEPWTTRTRRWLSRHRIAVSAAAAGLHGALWLTLFIWLIGYVMVLESSLVRFKMRLPFVTETVVRCSHPATDHPFLAVICLAAFVALDCWVHWRLSQSSGGRVVRELWSGVVVLVPTFLLCVATLSTLLPYVKFMEATTRFVDARDQRVQEERRLFEGTWKLVGLERSGKVASEKELEPGTFTFAGEQFSWTQGTGQARGTYGLLLSRRPKVLDLMHVVGEHQGEYQTGIYAFDGDRLRICLAPRLAQGDDLPVDFSTKENKCTTYTLQRVGKDSGN
jgi:uncharacterized protein (TIGR03067 family)